MLCEVRALYYISSGVLIHHLAMTAAQTRIAETLETFYGASDSTSEGAMAGHAYKRSVDDLDGGFGRELVRAITPNRRVLLILHSQDVPYRTTISEPLGKMCAYFPVINEHISKRNKKVRRHDIS